MRVQIISYIVWHDALDGSQPWQRHIKLVSCRSLIHILARVIVTNNHYQGTACLKPYALGKQPGITDSCNSRSWSLWRGIAGSFCRPEGKPANSTALPSLEKHHEIWHWKEYFLCEDKKKRGEDLKLVCWSSGPLCPLPVLFGIEHGWACYLIHAVQFYITKLVTWGINYRYLFRTSFRTTTVT